MNLKYKVLATVSLQHEYYTDGRCTDFSVVPTPATQVLLKNLGAVYKTLGNKIMVFVRVGENDQPMIPVPDDVSFVFYMLLENQSFYNFSNINYRPAAKKRYYFSNRLMGRFVTDEQPLPAAVATYDPGASYEVGDLVAPLEGFIAEAIRASDAGNAQHPLVTTYWLRKDKLSYVSNTDLATFVSGVYSYYPPAPATDFTIDILQYNPNGAMVPVGDTITQSYDTEQSVIQIPLTDLPDGRYIIYVNDAVNHVYLSAEATQRDVFGVIELLTAYVDMNYGLFDIDGLMLQPSYVIRFANRSFVWKYLTNENITGILYGDYDFHYVLDERSGIKSYVSNTPIPLVQGIAAADAPVKMKSDDSTETIAVPSFDKLSYITQNGNTYFCIEKYLPY